MIFVRNTRSTRRCKAVDEGSDKKNDLQPNKIANHKSVIKNRVMSSIISWIIFLHSS